MKKAALIILDGWGIGDGSKTDAISQAKTPNMDRYLATYPNSRLKTFAENVGLPAGQMGNSEVGHLNIGAGRIVYQDLAKINRAVELGELRENPMFTEAIRQAEKSVGAIHLMGLVSEGGVHSSQAHLHAMLDIIEESSISEIYIHAFTDGRDTEPKNAKECIGKLQNHLIGKRAFLASMVGRYYAMDRDKRWERIKVAYDLLVRGDGESTSDFAMSCDSLYERGVTDEFFAPIINQEKRGLIKANDVVICFNFRTDRCRQLTTAMTQQNLPDFDMHILPLYFVTMTRYDEKFRDVHVMFEKDNLQNTLGEIVSKNKGSQLRVAETEKYPHVTFFFSGGRELPFDGEIRAMANSPKVATYDLQPEMSAVEVAEKCIDALQTQKPDFVCLNFANPDMVGHTGVEAAIVKAVQTVDTQLGRVVDVAIQNEYSIIIIADHGNADLTQQPDGSPHTAHTLNPVPCILISQNAPQMIHDGILADIAPTILHLMEIDQPAEMTGKSLLK
jgi:2,3-bisphosphoglycerate-independent phosphoglycerate mutase